MKLMVVSDLHLEFEFKPLDTLDADVLVIAGDLSPLWKPIRLDEFFDHIDIPVVYVMGNHEYYHGSIGDTYKREGVHVLDNASIEIDGVVFAGSTYWSNPTEHALRQVNDYYLIKNFDIRELHKRDIAFLSAGFEADVVVTHFAPSYRSVSLEFAGSNLNSYFMNDDEHLVGGFKEKFWIHGHNHNSVDYMLNGVNVLANPKGYENENEEYNQGLMVEI